jgi:hypothetical protein
MVDVRDVRGIADERAARDQLRGQSRRSRPLSDAVISAFPDGAVHPQSPLQAVAY